jgi:hypothetical protein
MATGNTIMAVAGLFIGGLGMPPWFLKRCKRAG